VAETVNRAATTVALGSSLNPAVTGQAVTFTAALYFCLLRVPDTY
jgi:hypothetical protein